MEQCLERMPGRVSVADVSVEACLIKEGIIGQGTCTVCGQKLVDELQRFELYPSPFREWDSTRAIHVRGDEVHGGVISEIRIGIALQEVTPVGLLHARSKVSSRDVA